MSPKFFRIYKRILLWGVLSFFVVFFVAFCSYVNNDSKDGIYPEKEFGTLKEIKKMLNPYLNIYNIYKEKPNNLKSLNKVEQFGFGFNSSDNKSNGSIVQTVYSGSSAEKAGLQKGDIIVAVDGLPILNDNQLSEAIDPKERTELQIKREDQILNLSITKSYFIGEEGFNVGSSRWAYTGDLSEYSVEGISIFGALLIAFLWAITILPVLIFGIILYKPLSKIRYNIFIFLINLILIPIIMSGTMFLVYRSNFLDEMLRNSTDSGGGFIDLSIFIYPLVALFLSLFLIIGYTITLLIYKKYIKRINNFN